MLRVKDRLGKTFSKEPRSEYIRTASLPNCPTLYKVKAASSSSTPTKIILQNDLDENPEEAKEFKFRHRFTDIYWPRSIPSIEGWSNKKNDLVLRIALCQIIIETCEETWNYGCPEIMCLHRREFAICNIFLVQS